MEMDTCKSLLLDSILGNLPYHLTFCPSLTLSGSLMVGTPVWTKLIFPSSRSLRENKLMALENRCNHVNLHVLFSSISCST